MSIDLAVNTLHNVRVCQKDFKKVIRNGKTGKVAQITLAKIIQIMAENTPWTRGKECLRLQKKVNNTRTGKVTKLALGLYTTMLKGIFQNQNYAKGVRSNHHSTYQTMGHILENFLLGNGSVEVVT